MGISVFLSYPVPFKIKQENFIKKLKKYLIDRGFSARTLGVTDYDMKQPLTAIRRLMLESNGLLTIAFRRTLITEGIVNPNSEIKERAVTNLSDIWTTSAYCQIEPAMAYQIGLPVLILREKGVIADGILERGVIDNYLPVFDLDSSVNYLDTDEWKQIIGSWEGYVRKVVENKGCPPKLY